MNRNRQEAVLVYEERGHHHPPRLPKAALALHLTQPHRQKDGSWRSMAHDLPALMKWRMDELEHQHAEFHAEAAAP